MFCWFGFCGGVLTANNNNVTPIKQKLFSVSSSGRVTKPFPLPHKPLKMTYYLGVIDKRVFVPMIYFVINSFSNGKQLNHIWKIAYIIIKTHALRPWSGTSKFPVTWPHIIPPSGRIWKLRAFFFLNWKCFLLHAPSNCPKSSITS